MARRSPSPKSSRRPARGLVVSESLEQRRLLAASTLEEVRALAASADRSVDNGFALTVNFQPDAVAHVAQTRGDLGKPFGDRGNGFTYGWNRDLEADGDMIDRDSTRDLFMLKQSPKVGNGPDGEDQTVDERYDTIAKVEVGDIWSIEVPEGKTYAVQVVVGDAAFTGASGEHRTTVHVEGELLVDGVLQSNWPFAEAYAYYTPTDGTIDVEVVSGTIDGSIAWLRVAEVEALPAAQAGATFDWSLRFAGDDGEVVAPYSATRRGEGDGVRLGDQLIQFGGFTEAYTGTQQRVDSIDLNTGEIVQLRDLPAEASPTHAGTVADEARGLIYYVGGQLGIDFTTTSEEVSELAFVFEPDTGPDGRGLWSALPDLPEARSGGAAFITGNLLHFVGGVDSTGVLAQTQHWAIDLTEAVDNNDASADWKPMPPLPFGVDHFTVEVFEGASESGGDLVVVAGGEYDHQLGYSPRPFTQIYDVDQAGWMLGKMMPYGLSHPTSVAHNGRLWVFGGQTAGNNVVDNVLSYDVAADVWREHNPMPQTRKVGSVVVREDDSDDFFFYIGGDSGDMGFQLTTVQGTIVEEL